MSLLDTVFNFLAIGQYNSTPPSVGAAQPSYLQCDASGRLLVTVAGIRGGAAPLALPVATTTRAITTPTIANGFQVSAPFNSAAGVAFGQSMPAQPGGIPVRGMRCLLIDSGGFAAITPCAITDPAGYKIQDPMNPAAITSTLSFRWSGFAALFELIVGDPTNGTFWARVRSLQ